MIQLNPDDKRHRPLARLIVARRDIQLAKRAIEHITQHIHSNTDPLFDPLSCAAIICYSRPFVPTRRRPSLPARYDSFPTAELRSLHHVILKQRNDYMAHSDEISNRVVLMPRSVGVTRADGKQTGGVVRGDRIDSYELSLRSFPAFKVLCELQLTRLQEHISTEEDQLFHNKAQ